MLCPLPQVMPLLHTKLESSKDLLLTYLRTRLLTNQFLPSQDLLPTAYSYLVSQLEKNSKQLIDSSNFGLMLAMQSSMKTGGVVL